MYNPKTRSFSYDGSHETQCNSLVNANDFLDVNLKSSIGHFDGNAYEALLESLMKDLLNATDPEPVYKEHL